MSANTTPETVLARALREIADERMREKIEEEKKRIRAAKWWHKLFPFVITITRRKT